MSGGRNPGGRATDVRRTSWRANELAWQRTQLGMRLAGRFWLRWHATLILGFTFAVGLWTDAALLRWSNYDVISRWLLAFAAGYLAFFAGVRLWLAYVGARSLGDADSNWTNLDPGSSTNSHWHGHGGTSGGGGASGDFGGAPDGANAMLGSGGGPLDSAGDALGGVDEPVGWLVIVLALIALVLLSAFGAGAIYLIATAPELLGDVAFAALLASGLIPTVRRFDEPDWKGRLLLATWKPACAVALIVLVTAMAFRHYFPDARTLGDAWLALH
jgi:hypothetical protein